MIEGLIRLGLSTVGIVIGFCLVGISIGFFKSLKSGDFPMFCADLGTGVMELVIGCGLITFSVINLVYSFQLL